MKVGVRLGLNVGIALLALALVALFGVRGMHEVKRSLDDIASDNLVKIQLVSEARNQVRLIATSVRNIVLLTDLSAEQAEVDRIHAAREKYTDLFNQLTAKTTSDKGLAILAKARDAKAQTAPQVDQVIQFGLANNNSSAIQALMNNVRPAQNRWLAALDEYVTYQKQQTDADAQAAMNGYAHALTVMLVVGALAGTALIALGVSIVRSITRPLGRAVQIAERVAAGDLTMHVEVDSTDETGRLMAALGDMVQRLNATLHSVRSAADNLSAASEEVSSTSQSLSQGATEQAASVEQTSATLQQAAASVKQNADNARLTTGMAQEASVQARDGGEAVQRTVQDMQAIAQRISIVDDIAYQTNMLALNAAIEAARAGEHGKGFAVVAAEVRKLAERAQVAAKEIGELASGSVKQAEVAGNLLKQMVPAINRTAELVQEINAASDEQAIGIAQINQAVAQVNSATQQNASASEQLAATAEEMSGQAAELQRHVGQFRLAGGGQTYASSAASNDQVKAPFQQARTMGAAAPKPDANAEFVRF